MNNPTHDIPVRELCDERLQVEWADMDEAVQSMSEIVAENDNECAMYGDGPCGSMDNRHALNKYVKRLDCCRQEWYRRYPIKLNPITSSDCIPF